MLECSLSIIGTKETSKRLLEAYEGAQNHTIKEINGTASVSIEDFEFSEWSDFNKKTSEFLERLHALASPHPSNSKATLRTGIYYNINETSIFEISLSNELLSRISETGLNLEVSCYPCSD